MQRSSVDFPLPEGPMMHTTSPGCTDSETPLSTWLWPKLLCISSSRIMSMGRASIVAWSPSRGCPGRGRWLRYLPLAPGAVAALGDALQVAHEQAGRVADGEVEHEDHGVDGEVVVGAGGDDLAAKQQLLDGQRRGQRGVLEERDEVVAQHGDHDVDRK